MSARVDRSAAADFATCQPVLEVADVEAAVAFYVEQLGFELDFSVGEPPSYACVSRAGLSRGARASVRFTSWLRGRDTVRTGGWLNVFVETPIDALYAELVARGVQVTSGLADQPWGMREFEVRDLDGHHIRFASELARDGDD